MAADESIDLAGVTEHVRRRLAAGDCGIYQDLIREIDRVAIEQALEHVAGNQVQASRRLGVSRNTLRAKIQHLGAHQPSEHVTVPSSPSQTGNKGQPSDELQPEEGPHSITAGRSRAADRSIATIDPPQAASKYANS